MKAPALRVVSAEEKAWGEGWVAGACDANRLASAGHDIQSTPNPYRNVWDADRLASLIHEVDHTEGDEVLSPEAAERIAKAIMDLAYWNV
jgi:H2-forming N5,N10-methylenetetrahydromethanopterin dehydrogenase-like enzyme